MRQKWNGHSIYQRRPNPLKAVGQAHPTEVANGAAVDARLTQPETQGAQDQQQWQACGKAQEQHAQTGRLQIDTP